MEETLPLPTSAPPYVHSRVVDDPKPREWWHPKITIYRVLVLSTTIGLGSAKAVAVHRGDNFVSTSIEWIAGVAVYLGLFVIGGLESASRPNRYFAWLVKHDILGPFLTLVSNQPSTCYRSDQLEPDPLRHGSHPPITGYRVLVSAITILFGMAKASMSYLGLSGSANAMDWTFGIVVTTLLYCVGLYEDNPVGILPSLFETNYQPVLSSIFFTGGSFTILTTLYLGAMSVVVAWCIFWIRLLQMYWRANDAPLRTASKVAEPPRFLEYAHAVSIKIAVYETLWLMIAVGVAGFFVLLGTLIKAFGRVGIVRRSSRVIRQVLMFMLQRLSSWLPTFEHEIPAPTTQLWPYVRSSGRFLKRFGIHILCFSYAVTLFTASTIFWLSYIQFPLEAVTFLSIFFMLCICAAGALVSLGALVAPFVQGWNTPGYVLASLDNPFASIEVFIIYFPSLWRSLLRMVLG